MNILIRYESAGHGLEGEYIKHVKNEIHMFLSEWFCEYINVESDFIQFTIDSSLVKVVDTFLWRFAYQYVESDIGEYLLSMKLVLRETYSDC